MNVFKTKKNSFSDLENGEIKPLNGSIISNQGWKGKYSFSKFTCNGLRSSLNDKFLKPWKS